MCRVENVIEITIICAKHFAALPGAARRLGPTSSAMALLALSVPPALGAEGDAHGLTISHELVRDDNLFRMPDDTRPVIDGRVRQRSDTVNVTALSATFDRTYGRQRLVGELGITRNDYLEFNHLDFTAKNCRGTWLWGFGKQWSGTVTTEQSESLRSFADRGTTTRSVNTYRRHAADARYRLDPRWAVGVGWVHADSRYDEPRSSGSEYVEDAFEALAHYRSPTDSTLTFVARGATGRYPGRERSETSMTGYEQRDLLLRANWMASGHSRISGNIGYTWREYPHVSEKNFSGLTGRLTHDWTPSGKVGLGVTVRREMGAREDVADNFVITRAVSVDPSWVVSSKIQVRGKVEWLRRDYGGDPFASVSPDRDDRTRAVSVAVEWTPVRAVVLRLGARSERRFASAAAPGYAAQGAFLSAKFRI
ncbi:hypothetical protein GPA27_14190 [Aromatoleum toluolicum]|uniref:Exopolysaccharide biosynthesis operon protein EpsL n=1 Tax=Aromatoleum toluolicum TaxID=90060 RepID=A0ABX1NGX6_9RHOO|nr:XrtB/PEP-CTERM-associated polysaccharide biosynthesis outer membrane protein EpsL [Aromatoleum toluolicum]NMF98535.1 hypothetical protein [Aromatoleum toluolicum]